MEILKYQFIQNAIMASLLASIVCGVIGVIIVEKKLVMLSGGIAHTAYGGVGLGYLCGFEPMLGAVIFSLSAALGVGYIKRNSRSNSDTIISLFWSVGMALGILFVAIMPGYPPDMNSYLFGNILAVVRSDVIATAIMTVLLCGVVFAYFNLWKLYLFDEEFASIIGINTAVLEYSLLSLIALSVVVLIRVVGIILVLSLLTAPAATASFMTNNMLKRMIIAAGLGMAFCLTGIYFSYLFAIPSGATIVIVSALVYFIAYGINAYKNRRAKK